MIADVHIHYYQCRILPLHWAAIPGHLFLGVCTQDLPQKVGTVIAYSWFSNPDPSDEEIKQEIKGTSLLLVTQLLAAFLHSVVENLGMIFRGPPLAMFTRSPTKFPFYSLAQVRSSPCCNKRLLLLHNCPLPVRQKSRAMKNFGGLNWTEDRVSSSLRPSL